eukprot:9296300-Alexandrium_andersonii.AAC.1
MRKALDYPFNSLEFLKYYYSQGPCATWVEPETGPPIIPDNRSDLVPAWTGVRTGAPDVARRRQGLSNPYDHMPIWHPRRPENKLEPIPRDRREQSRQQKRNARDAPTSTPREAKKQQTQGANVPGGRAAEQTGRTW